MANCHESTSEIYILLSFSYSLVQTSKLIKVRLSSKYLSTSSTSPRPTLSYPRSMFTKVISSAQVACFVILFAKENLFFNSDSSDWSALHVRNRRVYSDIARIASRNAELDRFIQSFIVFTKPKGVPHKTTPYYILLHAIQSCLMLLHFTFYHVNMVMATLLFSSISTQMSAMMAHV